jgi:hypothetical protein
MTGGVLDESRSLSTEERAESSQVRHSRSRGHHEDAYHEFTRQAFPRLDHRDTRAV